MRCRQAICEDCTCGGEPWHNFFEVLGKPFESFTPLNPLLMETRNTIDCIEACYDCAVACENCATACLHEPHFDRLIRCIELDRQCAAMCRAVAEVLSVDAPQSASMAQLCAEMCDVCAEECARHAAEMDHCRRCAEACRTCAEECRAFAGMHQSIH